MTVEEKIGNTLANYIKYKGFRDTEKEEFIAELCDTTKINGFNLKVYTECQKKS